MPSADLPRMSWILMLPPLLAAPPLEGRYLEPVRAFCDVLLERGTDRYGPLHTPLWMSVIDTRSGDAPRAPELFDSYFRTEERPGRRNPGGCDPWDDQPLVRAMLQLGEWTGEPRYGRAVEAYLEAFCRLARKENGLLGWGSHLYYDAFDEAVRDDGHGHVHEILVHLPDWARLHAVAPEAVRREIEGIWRWHIVDPATGLHNRHDDAQPGCDFAFSGGSFAVAFAFWYRQTGDPVWLERARLVAEHHWRARHPETNLTPDAPSTGGRYDSTHCFTTVPGPHAAALLRCWELTGEAWFRDVAVAYLKAYDRYGWDPAARQFWAMLRLDGTPVPEQPKGAGYDAWMPTGHVDLWPTTMYSYEWPLLAAQTTIWAYELTGDPDLLAAARHWAENLEVAGPPTVGRRWRAEVFAAVPEFQRAGGAYAEGYGRAISFLVALSRATGEAAPLDRARALADEALAKLRRGPWLVGHAGKPYYEAVDGVGVLVHALLELAAAPAPLPPNI